MTEPTARYKTNLRGNRLAYELTEAEARIVDWIRTNSNNCDWAGTIRYVSGPCVYQLSNHVKAGIAKNAP